MSYELVVKQGRLITANGSFVADLGISGEQITAIGASLKGRHEIDAVGLYVLPGGIDGHVHFDNPTFPPYDPPTADSFATGSIAAAFGGVTTVIDFAQPWPGQSLVEELERRKTDAEGQSIIDYGLHLNYRDPDPARLDEIPAVFEHGVPSFKLYMAYDGYRLSDVEIFRAMRAIAAYDGLAIMHAENFDIVQELKRELSGAGKTAPQWHVAAYPATTEGAAIYLALALAQLAGTRVLIFHVSCAEGVREIGLAKQRGQAAFGETCPHHLAYTEEVYQQDNIITQSLAVVPPIRDASHQAALWEGLAQGNLDIVGTDHCPRPVEEGQARQRPGVSGLETRMALIHSLGVRTGRISLERWVELCSTGPAKLYGLSKKGHLLPGYDADIVLFDPNREVTFSPDQLHTPLSFSSYEGVMVKGYPVTTISRGEVVVDNGQLVAKPGRGRFIPRYAG